MSTFDEPVAAIRPLTPQIPAPCDEVARRHESATGGIQP